MQYRANSIFAIWKGPWRPDIFIWQIQMIKILPSDAQQGATCHPISYHFRQRERGRRIPLDTCWHHIYFLLCQIERDTVRVRDWWRLWGEKDENHRHKLCKVRPKKGKNSFATDAAGGLCTHIHCWLEFLSEADFDYGTGPIYKWWDNKPLGLNFKFTFYTITLKSLRSDTLNKCVAKFKST